MRGMRLLFYDAKKKKSNKLVRKNIDDKGYILKQAVRKNNTVEKKLKRKKV